MTILPKEKPNGIKQTREEVGVREGARNPLRKAGNYQHEIGRGKRREMHAKRRILKKLKC